MRTKQKLKQHTKSVSNTDLANSRLWSWDYGRCVDHQGRPWALATWSMYRGDSSWVFQSLGAPV